MDIFLNSNKLSPVVQVLKPKNLEGKMLSLFKENMKDPKREQIKPIILNLKG